MHDADDSPGRTRATETVSLAPSMAALTAGCAVLWGIVLTMVIDPFTAGVLSLQALMVFAVATRVVERVRRRSPDEHEEGAAALTSARDRLSLETALVETTRAILRDRDTMEVEAAMARLIRSAGCDLMLVSRNSELDESIETRVVYAAGRREGVVESVDWGCLPHTASSLSTGRSHQFGSLEEIAEPDRNFYLHAPVRIEAAAVFPVMVQGRWVGHVGLFTIERTRRWQDSDFELLSTVADMLASAWQRNDAVADLERAIAQRDRSLAIQTAITGSARMLFESGDEDIDGALDLIRGALDVDAVYVRDLRSRGLHGVGLETRTVAITEGSLLPPSLERGSWLSWPPVYAPILDTRPLIVTDTAALAPTQARWYADYLPTSAADIAFPIVTGGSVVGILGATTVSTREWGAGEIRTLATVAQMLGVARTRNDARRNLEDIVRAKDRFIASVSHELRTPMAVVMGLSSELNTRRQDFTDEEVAEFIDLITRQSTEVGHIIEDLLVSARASAESITVLPEMLRLDRAVQEALGSMSAEQTRRIASMDLGAVSTYADPLRVRQIIRNLVTNGHRYGGARVFIRVAVVDGHAVLEVADDGPGIPPDRRVEIFEAYFGGEREGRTASIGLGLTVSRQLARLMGGDVRYIHEPLPTFRLTLPVGAIHSSQDESYRALAG